MAQSRPSDARGQGLYRLKPVSQRLVGPLADALIARRVHPDAITFAAIPVALAGGICLAFSSEVRWPLLLVPILATARLVLNLLDGMVARRTATARRMGEIWNELGDRVCDVLFIGGLAFTPAVGTAFGFVAVIAALLASYAGLASASAVSTAESCRSRAGWSSSRSPLPRRS